MTKVVGVRFRNVGKIYYFSPKNYVTKKITITANTYSIHHFAGTWQPLWKRLALKIWVPFSVKYPGLAKVIKEKI